MGMPISIKGYPLLMRMICIACAEPSEAEFVTKTLYPRVAKEFSTRVGALEHACRRAISHVYDCRYIDSIDGYLDENKNRLGLGAFIVLTAEKIRNGEL